MCTTSQVRQMDDTVVVMSVSRGADVKNRGSIAESQAKGPFTDLHGQACTYFTLASTFDLTTSAPVCIVSRVQWVCESVDHCCMFCSAVNL